MKPATRWPVDSDEEPAVPFGTFRPSERRALISCAFASGCILLMPQEIIGALISFALAGGLGLWHWRRSKREAAPIAALPAETQPVSAPSAGIDRG